MHDFVDQAPVLAPRTNFDGDANRVMSLKKEKAPECCLTTKLASQPIPCPAFHFAVMPAQQKIHVGEHRSHVRHLVLPVGQSQGIRISGTEDETASVKNSS
jgi:hypothetical protein